jgi:hypothetical protein
LVTLCAKRRGTTDADNAVLVAATRQLDVLHATSARRSDSIEKVVDWKVTRVKVEKSKKEEDQMGLSLRLRLRFANANAKSSTSNVK